MDPETKDLLCVIAASVIVGAGAIFAIIFWVRNASCRDHDHAYEDQTVASVELLTKDSETFPAGKEYRIVVHRELVSHRTSERRAQRTHTYVGNIGLWLELPSASRVPDEVYEYLCSELWRWRYQQEHGEDKA